MYGFPSHLVWYSIPCLCGCWAPPFVKTRIFRNCDGMLHATDLSVAPAEVQRSKALDIVHNTTRRASLEAWRKLLSRFEPQTVGKKQSFLSRILNPGAVKVRREPWNSGKNVSDCTNPEREKELPMMCALRNPDKDVP